MKQIWLSAGLLMLGACTPATNQPDLLRGSSGVAAPSGTTAGASVPTAGAASAGNANMMNAQASAGAPSAGRGTAGSTGTAGSATVIAGASGQGTAGSTAGRGAAGSTGAAGGGASTAGTVTVEFTTVSYGGQYAPLNYVAVWFEDSSKKFIKTAERDAGAVHATDLASWTAASGGWPFLGGPSADQTDAVSAATVRMHQKHTTTWKMKDAQMQVVPNGDYVAVIEMTEDRALTKMGPVLRIPFKKGPDAQTVMVPNEASFTGVVLKYTP